MVRHHAVTVIPSIQSLKVTTLARQTARARQTVFGVADPIFGDGTTPPDQQVASLDARAAMSAGACPKRSKFARLPEQLAPRWRNRSSAIHR
ncbi:MAG: hypothetical protein R3D81_09695 [Thalassovita sp.]